MAVKLTTEEPQEEQVTKKWKVTLSQLSDGVDVNVEDRYDSWVLIKIKNDGTFYRYESVGKDAGFKLSKDGKIIESKLED